MYILEENYENCKKFKFETFQSALYSTSGGMPLTLGLGTGGWAPSIFWVGAGIPGGFFKKNRTGMLKVEFKISTISIPRKAWFCDPSLYHFSAKSTQSVANWVLFSWIFQNTPNFANWAHWVCDDNPPIDIPKLSKMHLKTFEHPRIPFVSEKPPPPGQEYLWAPKKSHILLKS